MKESNVLDREVFVPNNRGNETGTTIDDLELHAHYGWPVDLILLKHPEDFKFAANNITLPGTESDPELSGDFLACFISLEDAVAYQYLHQAFADFKIVNKRLSEAKEIAQSKSFMGCCMWMYNGNEITMGNYFFV